MPKFLRSLAVPLFAAVTLASLPAAGFIPTCYSNLPKHQVADPSWQYSHQCREGTTIWYVYIDSLGRWHLVSTNVPP
jgi:hypothetical protein